MRHKPVFALRLAIGLKCEDAEQTERLTLKKLFAVYWLIHNFDPYLHVMILVVIVYKFFEKI